MQRYNNHTFIMADQPVEKAGVNSLEETSKESKKEEDKESRTLRNAEDLVSRLYEFSAGYFDTRDISAAPQKKQDIEEKLEHVLKELESLQDDMSKPMAAYFRGRALNISTEYNPEAEQLLSQAVKHHPSLVDAWNCLGECYWRNGKLQQAQQCFIGAISRKPTKEALRNLSMILRQIGKDASELEANVKDSVEKAKQAVALDVTDGKSWVVMGNAHLSMYFSIDQDPKLLRQCASAYQQAEKDHRIHFYSDFHFNKSTLLLFEEQYSEALQSLEMACKLDPGWTLGLNKLENARKLLQNITKLVAGKGKIKAKRFATLVQVLQQPDKWAGRYSPSHRVVGVKELLEKGGGQGTLFLGVIVASITPEEGVPLACVVVDEQGECLCVSLYNLAGSSRLNIGDVLGVPCPSVHHILLPELGVDYWSVRVIQPQQLSYNGGALPHRMLSRIVLRSSGNQ